MFKKVLLCIVGFVALAKAALPDVVETAHKPFKFDDFIQGEYYSEKLNFAQMERLVMRFELKDIDTSNWDDGQGGFYIALGFGNVQENDWHNDLVMCEYIHNDPAPWK